MTPSQLHNARVHLRQHDRPLPPKLNAAQLCRYAALALRNRLTGDDVDALDKTLGKIPTASTLTPLSDSLRARIADEACSLARELVVDVGTQDRFVKSIGWYRGHGNHIDIKLGHESSDMAARRRTARRRPPG
jgi:hypothetical protein